MKPEDLPKIADAVVRFEAEQDIRGRLNAFDKLADAVSAVPMQQRPVKQSNKTTQQVALALIREARSRHGG